MTSGKKSDFCLRLPKIELHAHLTGSITRPILQAIWDERAEHDIEFANQVPSPRLALQDDREGQDIGSFFGLFNTYLYKLISDLESLRKATRAVLEAFRDDGVVYLELRTTPRALPGHTSPETVREILAVLQAWNASEADGGVMRVNLILSIDRAKHDAVMAGEIVDLAMKTRDEGLPVVGIDICGDPQQPLNTEVMRLNILKAKEAGLGVTIHFAEVPLSSSHAELDDILSWGPDRLGHVIHVSADIQRRIIQAGIAVELCLTCNVLAGMLPRTPGAPTPTIANHHFASWWDQPSSRHLISLGTDDVGVFGSMPSEEHFLAMEHFHLSNDDLVELSRNAIRFSFASEQEKRKVVSVLEQFRP